MLEMQVLNARNKILGEEHLHTIWAMASLAGTYQKIGKYTEAERLQIRVLDLRNQMCGVEHSDTILAKANLAETYRHLGKHTEEKLEIYTMDEVNPNIAESSEAKKLKTQVPDATIKVLTGEYPEPAVGADTNVAGMHDTISSSQPKGRLSCSNL